METERHESLFAALDGMIPSSERSVQDIPCQQVVVPGLEVDPVDIENPPPAEDEIVVRRAQHTERFTARFWRQTDGYC